MDRIFLFSLHKGVHKRPNAVGQKQGFLWTMYDVEDAVTMRYPAAIPLLVRALGCPRIAIVEAARKGLPTYGEPAFRALLKEIEKSRGQQLEQINEQQPLLPDGSARRLKFRLANRTEMKLSMQSSG